MKRRYKLYTIGHSTRTIEQFLALLKAHGIEKVVDIRTIPKSRHNPQFNAGNLREILSKAHVRYQHLKALGGLRHPRRASVNLGWRNASFRGFADYMQTADFGKGLEHLKKIAKKQRTVVMCAEAVPWRCHRSLIADALAAQGWQVLHIQSKSAPKLHLLTSFLKVSKGKIVYPAIRGWKPS